MTIRSPFDIDQELCKLADANTRTLPHVRPCARTLQPTYHKGATIMQEPLRSLSQIAFEIEDHIRKASIKRPGNIPAWATYSRPYVNAMKSLSSTTDRYLLGTGRDIVLRALYNLQSWRGEDARRIKAELQAHLDYYPAGKLL